MANPLAITTLHASAAEATSGTGPTVDITALRQAAKLTLEITAVTGSDTPTLTVTIETSPSGTGSWQQVVAFASQGAVGSVDLVTAKLRHFIRARWTITGTAVSITFALTGEAHQIYATVEQSEGMAIPAAALATLTDQEKAQALLRASDFAEGKIAGSFTMPISAWGDDVRGAVADLYVYHALSKRGFNPELGTDQLIVERKNDATKWLTDVAAGRVKPPGIVDSTPESYEGGSYVVSRARRGW
jgi:phage gp36-like protein